MRKLSIGMFSLLAIMMMTMPAYAQGGAAAAPTTNWVAIASGFGMAIAAASLAAIDARDLFCWDAFMVSSLFHSPPALGLWRVSLDLGFCGDATSPE